MNEYVEGWRLLGFDIHNTLEIMRIRIATGSHFGLGRLGDEDFGAYRRSPMPPPGLRAIMAF